jgi:hypothetical protein
LARPWSCLVCRGVLGTIGRDRDEADVLNLSDLPTRVEWRADHVLVTCRCGEVRTWRRGRVLLETKPCGSICPN